MQSVSGFIYSPLFIHHFPLRISKNITRAKNYLYENPSPELLNSTSEKIRYYRYKNGLLQKEIALAIGITKNTYVKYEHGVSLCPKEKLIALAELFQTEVANLLDDYNRFLFDGAGEQIRLLRSKLNVSQKDFGALLGVHASTVYKWEHETRLVTPETYQQLHQLASSNHSLKGVFL